MSRAMITEGLLTNIANAIRTKLGVSTTYTPAEMATAIGQISGYPEPTGSVNITQNGTANVKDYASANVNVPNSYAAGDEGKVVSNGALVAQTAHATVTENGTIDTTLNNSVVVNVSGGGVSQWNSPIIRNWDFAHPVNTRGSSSYSGAASINGWKCVSGTTCVLTTGGIYVQGTSTNMYYQMDITAADFTGKQFTLSLLVDGVLDTTTFTWPSATGRIDAVSAGNVELWLNLDTTTRFACGFYHTGAGDNSLIQAVKLEYGATQTLAVQENGVWRPIQYQNANDEIIFTRKCAVNF